MISLIVAHDPNRVIGFEQQKCLGIFLVILAYFKEKTMDKAMVMGRKTFESIGQSTARYEKILSLPEIPIL